MARHLSPEAQARLAAARAIAQGQPFPSPSSGPRGNAPGPKNPTTGEPPAKGSRKGGIVLLAFVGVIGMGTIAAGAWMTLGRRPDLVGSIATIQKGLLSGETRGAEGKRAVAEVIRNADQMTKNELETARKSLEETWKQIRDEAIDAFVAAPEADRPRLAGEGIERTLAYRKLRFGLSPQANGMSGRRQKPPRDEDRRKLFDRYAEALKTEAQKRGIELPEWQ